MRTLIKSILFVGMICLILNGIALSPASAQSPTMMPVPVQDEGFESMLFQEVPTVITAATLKETNPKTAPANVYVVSGDQIRRWGIRRLTELVDRLVPGAATTEDADNIALAFRGIASDDNNKVTLLLNGHNYNTQWNNGPTSESELGLLEDVERVEVILGPGSALYGSGATIAVINMVTKSGKNMNKKLGGSLFTSVGSGNYKKTDLALGSKRDEDLDYYFSGGFLNAQGFDNNNNHPLNINRYPTSGRVYGSINYKNWELMTRYSSSARAFWNATSGAVNSWTNYDTFFLDVKNNIAVSDDWKIVPNVAFDTIQTQRHDFGTSAKLRGVGEDRYTAKVTSFYKGLDRHDIVIGAEVHSDSIGDDWTGDNFSIASATATKKICAYSYRRTSYAAFAQDEIKVAEKIDLLLGARFDKFKLYQLNKDSDGAFTPRVAIVTKPTEKSIVKLMYTTGLHMPIAVLTAPETSILFGGTRTVNIQKPEKMSSWEIDTDYKFNDVFEFELNTFLNSFRNIHVLTGSTFTTSQQVDFYGFESILHAKFKKAQFRILHQYVKPASTNDAYGAHVSTDEQNILTYPEQISKLLVDVPLSKTLSVNTNINYVYNTFGYEGIGVIARTGPYATVNANIVYSPKKDVEFIVGAYNLLDENRKTPQTGGSTANVKFVPLAGRNFNLSFRYKF